tara:strand:+ start:186 stop:395 length:210 start_codon:yes stop_codon:yes gene_type:complete
MKKILIFFFILNLNNVSYSNEIKCETALQILKPSCNFIGTGAKKLKELSEKNKTIDQTYNTIKEKIKKK